MFSLCLDVMIPPGSSLPGSTEGSLCVDTGLSGLFCPMHNLAAKQADSILVNGDRLFQICIQTTR